ncbi:O-antigen ligase family protein [Bacteroidota bacterium]
MSKPLTLSSDYSDIFREKLYLPIIAIIGFLAFLSLLLFIGTVAEGTLISLAVIGCIPLIYLMIRFPRIWIYLIALSNIYFFYGRGADVSVIEVVLAVQYLGSIGVWFFWELFVKREKLIQNVADLAVMFYFLIILANSVIAYTNEIEMLYWAREAANLLLLAIYFPIRKYFTVKKHLIILLVIYSFVVSATAFLHFYTYAKALQADLVYAYQLAQGIRVNQTLFTSAAMFGFIYALYSKNRVISILLIVFTSISIIGLVTSFSRTFWILLVFELIVIVYYLTGRQRIKLIIYTLITTVILLSAAFFVFQDKAKIAFTLIENRFVSATKGTKDISVQSRFDEYEVVWKGIKEHPMGGNGLAKEISFWNLLSTSTSRARFIHNGYLFIMFRLGIPAALICFFPYFYYFIKGERFGRKIDDSFFRLLSVGSFMSIFLMLVSNFTASQIIQREGVFVTALSFAFIGIVMEKIKNGSIKLR